MTGRWLRVFCLAGALCIGCAPSLPRPYVETSAAGHRAYSSGRYDEAATYFRSAAGKAERIRNRDEMLYLEAASLQRAGRDREARSAYEALTKLSPHGERTARAAYELVKFELQEGNEAKGWKMMHDFFIAHPESGLARRALLRYLKHLDDRDGPQATIAFLNKGYEWFDAHDLGEAAMYEKALRLERLDRLQEARNTFVACANKYPYPDGGLFDDALYRASQIDEKLGHPRKAIELLHKMLYVREPSTFQGSYERPRFSAAQMRIAELYRDELHEPSAARREFRKLYDSFTTSILRDDALWAEAEVASKQGDRRGACDAVSLLVRKLPESRYAPCAKLLCDDAPKLDEPRRCHPYIARELGEAQ